MCHLFKIQRKKKRACANDVSKWQQVCGRSSPELASLTSEQQQEKDGLPEASSHRRRVSSARRLHPSRRRQRECRGLGEEEEGAKKKN